MPAPWVMDGGGGLSTICGLGFMNREKKLGHIYSESCLALHISFCLMSLAKGEASQEKNCYAILRHDEPHCFIVREASQENAESHQTRSMRRPQVFEETSGSSTSQIIGSHGKCGTCTIPDNQ